MFQTFKIATLAALVQTVEAHVRAIPTGVGCRNCNGNASPGKFSVGGPLGGNLAFGANGINKATVGQEIELAIAYNGGHKSGTLNFFNVRYACGAAAGQQATFNRVGGTDKNTINCGAPCKQLTAAQITQVDGQAATASNYPVDATASKTSGYNVKFKVPEIQGTGEDRKCTFALVEGRNWGSGWDFEIAAKVATQAVTQPTTPTTTAPPKSLSGTYTFTNGNCQKDAPNCKCLTGDIQVNHVAGAKTATALVRAGNFPNHVVEMTESIPGALSLQYLLANCDETQSDQLLDINLSPAGTSQGSLNVGVIDEVPTFCGSIVQADTKATSLVSPPNIEKCPYCQDEPNWQDKDGESCAQYTSCANGNWRTKGLDHYQKFTREGKTAMDACCACGGGTIAVPKDATTAEGATTAVPEGATINPFANRVSSPAQAVGVASGVVLTAFAAVFV